MKSGKKIQAVVLDPYDTLFNMFSITAKCEEKYPGNGYQLAQLWHRKQLEHSWLRTMTNLYKNFWRVTEDALSSAISTLGLKYDKHVFMDIMSSWLHLELHQEAIESLKVFRPWQLTILSNGNSRMLDPLTADTGLDQWFDGILMADAARAYKPSHKIYELAVAHLKMDKEKILYVTSNAWDITGAKSFGFTVGCVQRSNSPLESLGYSTDYVASDLLELARKVKTEGILI